MGENKTIKAEVRGIEEESMRTRRSNWNGEHLGSDVETQSIKPSWNL